MPYQVGDSETVGLTEKDYLEDGKLCYICSYSVHCLNDDAIHITGMTRHCVADRYPAYTARIQNKINSMNQ